MFYRIPFTYLIQEISQSGSREFARHEALSKMTGSEIYFVLYHSWERGLNENPNGLIRQYFLKKTDFTKIADTQLRQVQNLLNNRHRKKLGYLSLNECLIKE